MKYHLVDALGGEEDVYFLLLRAFQISCVIVVGGELVFGSPYGSQSTYKGALALNGRLTWVLMELVSPVALLYSYYAMDSFVPVARSKSHSLVSIAFCALWIMHYVNRALVYPLRQTSRKPMHIGIGLTSCLFNTLNGYLNGRWFSVFSNGLYNEDYLNTHTLQVVFGLCLFVLGMVGNIYHDNILMGLRRPATGKPNNRYSVPVGGLFAMVSCPHYFCEVVEWTGYAILTQSPAAWTFALATLCNLLPRAYSIHKWYQREFPKYPANRKAMIPYII
ncbi:hypothetical protein GGI03_005860 [Coemansia sp. RSA 2337]|nr:hypothetical protein LPJ71_006237 [Coemansia sp. S17]KAJ2014593.1 hypothetical protein GGI14_004763 [Coemansia sp. S680]KAJ2028234.1 hypothetical protein H4S03_007924 [Coemansia sp. S3946]KAJ2092853.1 hypothetical protein GGI09_005849 [Coemansia sp. S100]KAJ2458292.1 hypothetical protein GGI03_005860 [Coemansia sp. RSA 2337]